MASATNFCLIVKWSGKEYSIKDLCYTQTIDDLKTEICKLTQVLPERQKLIGLKHRGKDPNNDVKLGDLNVRPGQKVMMIGTREEELTDVLTLPSDLPEVINDFDIGEEEIALENRDEYLAKIEKRVRDNKVTILNEPRPGKKLLVLDIDYTLFDHRSVAENANELIRPFLHELLTDVYPYYDIVIWSATSMKWIEVKMKELGVSIHPDYKLCFMLDSSAMISVHLPKYGLVDVKPLAVIWGTWPQWSHRNTVMFDDIRKNFLMNPQSGLRIRPFREAHLNRHRDRELVLLSKYLLDIAELDDFSVLNHRRWEKYRPRKKPLPHSIGYISSSDLSHAVTTAIRSDAEHDNSDGTPGTGHDPPPPT